MSFKYMNSFEKQTDITESYANLQLRQWSFYFRNNAKVRLNRLDESLRLKFDMATIPNILELLQIAETKGIRTSRELKYLKSLFLTKQGNPIVTPMPGNDLLAQFLRRD